MGMNTYEELLRLVENTLDIVDFFLALEEEETEGTISLEQLRYKTLGQREGDYGA